jgi:hypothetical protein
MLNFFDMIKEITYYKSDLNFDDTEINNAYNIFMINRYLATIELFVPFIAMLNSSKIGKKEHYEFLRNVIPKRSYDFNYIKKEVDKDYEFKIKCLCEYLEVGKKEADIYLQNFISGEQMERIMSVYQYGKNGKRSSIEKD